MTDKIKVLYIAGAGRSGSTVLGQLLGEVEGLIHIGEATRYLYNAEMFARNLPCSCGHTIDKCLFWGDLSSGIDNQIQEFGSRVIRIRYLPFLILPFKTRRQREHLQKLKASLRQLLVGIHCKSESAIIVDTSKNPAHAFILSQIPEVELYVVHLVRDPRGVVSSWTQSKGYLQKHPVLHSIVWWLAYNLSSEALRIVAKGYRLVRYEHFAENPVIVIKIVSQTLGVEVDLQSTEQALTTANQHSLAGNPVKFTKEPVIVRKQAWDIAKHIQILTWILTLPLALRYRMLPKPQIRA